MSQIPDRDAATPSSRRSPTPHAAPCTTRFAEATGRSAATNSPSRPGCPGRRRHSTSTGSSTSARSPSNFADVSGRTGPGAGRPAKVYSVANDEVTASLPARQYELAGDLLAAAAEYSDRNGVPVRDACSRPRSIAGTSSACQTLPLVDTLVGIGYAPIACDDGGYPPHELPLPSPGAASHRPHLHGEHRVRARPHRRVESNRGTSGSNRPPANAACESGRCVDEPRSGVAARRRSPGAARAVRRYVVGRADRTR